MKCGGCVRAVEQRLRQQPGVHQASVNLLSRTAWLELEPEPRAAAPGRSALAHGAPPPQRGAPAQLPLVAARAGSAPLDPEAWLDRRLEPVLASLRELGFEARRRSEGPSPLSRRERLRRQHWWQRWRRLFVALSLVLVSALGHAAESGALPAPLLALPLADPWLHALVATLALAGPGRAILIQGARSAVAGLPSMDTLVGLGMASAWLASAVGLLWPASGWPCFFNEPVMLLGFVLAGRFLEERARWRTGRAIEELAELQPEQALLLIDDGPSRTVRVGGLRPGDRILVLPGDRLPVDAQVLLGASAVDLSALTGEAMPVPVEPGSELAAGSLNLTAPLQLAVRRSGAESAIARIIHLVEQAQARKAPIQGLADRVAGRFAVAVLLFALATLLFWWLIGTHLWPSVLQAPGAHGGLHGAHSLGGHGAMGSAALPAAPMPPLVLALELAIAVLVVACPCALGLATPTAISVGTGLAARSGLLFRGGEAIEQAAAVRTLLFDKTGTLTLGRPLVTAIEPLVALPAERIVQLAASLESGSRHPLAHALLQQAQALELPLLPLDSQEQRTVAGEGVLARLAASPADLIALLMESGAEPAPAASPPAPAAGQPAPPVSAPLSPPLLRIGRLDWLAVEGIRLDPAVLERQAALETEGATLLALAAETRLLGLIAVEDQPRADAAATLAALRQRGLQLGLLSGDRRVPVQRLGARLGFAPEELAWELRPAQKLERILAARGSGPVAMVGDGINDAPALAAADLGIAVGTGTQIAQESAALVVMGEGLEGVLTALTIAAATMAKVRQNLIWAFGYNLIVIPIAAGALLPAFSLRLTPPLAALLMALSSITVVVNALLLQGLPAGGRRHRAGGS
ncbi:MAG: heavy metal translocating P-type ATPase [Cyanobium sp.]